MKRILCFGDSNTWGYNPASGERHDENTRWTALLQKKMPEDIVIEEGCNGRTAIWEDPIEQHKNGLEYLIPCLMSHKPLDLVVLMLGTNDCKTRFNLSSSDIANGVSVLCERILQPGWARKGGVPKLLLLCPPYLNYRRAEEYISSFDGRSNELSRELPIKYQVVADTHSCAYLDLSKHATVSQHDGIHLDAQEHVKIANLVYTEVQKIL